MLILPAALLCHPNLAVRLNMATKNSMGMAWCEETAVYFYLSPLQGFGNQKTPTLAREKKTCQSSGTRIVAILRLHAQAIASSQMLDAFYHNFMYFNVFYRQISELFDLPKESSIDPRYPVLSEWLGLHHHICWPFPACRPQSPASAGVPS